MVANLATERATLSEDVCAFFAYSEIADAYKIYCSERDVALKGISSLSTVRTTMIGQNGITNLINTS